MSDRHPHDPSRGIVPLTPGPSPLPGQTFEGNRLDIPIVILAALEATGIRVHTFLARLALGAIWQDQSIRSKDGEIDIQAYLAHDGLRCVIRLGAGVWYHHPLETLHVWGMPLSHIDQDETVPLESILPHALLDTLPIMVIGITPLNTIRPDIGISLRVSMPEIPVDLPANGR